MKKWPDAELERQMLKDACYIAEGSPEEMRTSDYVGRLLDRVRELEKRNLLYRMACEAFVRYKKTADTMDDVQTMLDFAEARNLIREALEEDNKP